MAPGPGRARTSEARARGAAAHPAPASNAAEAFETFLQTKYVGQKRFSLEGGESVIPLLDAVIDSAAEARLDEVVIGMAHDQAERAGEHRRQVVRADLPRVRGQPRPALDARLRRRQVPPGRRGHLHRSGRRADQGLAGRQPLAPGGGRPGPGGHRPRQAGHHQQGRHGLHGPAGRAPRRRGLRGPGRRRRDAQHVAAARLPHRRHRACGDQQPGRLHRRPGVLALLDVRHRRGAHDRGADHPRERRRPGGRGPRRAARLRVPAGVQQGRRDRPHLLPAPRSQRDRQPGVHQPADVHPGRQEALGAQAVHRVPHRSRRHHTGRGGAGAPGLPGSAGEGVRGGPRGHLAMRPPRMSRSRRPRSR